MSTPEGGPSGAVGPMRLYDTARGDIVPFEPGEVVTLDTGNVTAFESTITYNIRKAGGNWKTTLLGGEGLVTEFTGPGRLWWQTRSSSDLIQWIALRLQANGNT